MILPGWCFGAEDRGSSGDLHSLPMFPGTLVPAVAEVELVSLGRARHDRVAVQDVPCLRLMAAVWNVVSKGS